MSKLAVIGTIETAPRRREQLLPLLMEHRSRCLSDEIGTLSFEIMTSNEDETKIYLHEVYQDAAAFEVHLNSPSIKQWRGQSAGAVIRVAVLKSTPVE